MFAMIKALYTDVESFVYFNGVSSQAFPLYQGSGQGRILAPSMCKVYINRLIETVSNSKCPLVIDKLRTGSPTFADDMTLLSVFPSFMRHLMQDVTQYSNIWRYDYNPKVVLWCLVNHEYNIIVKNKPDIGKWMAMLLLNSMSTKALV